MAQRICSEFSKTSINEGGSFEECMESSLTSREFDRATFSPDLEKGGTHERRKSHGVAP